MKNKIIKISMLVIIMIMGLGILTGCTETTNTEKNNTTKTKIVEKKVECEHDWVVTSKYSFFTNSYKTISKCSKCGKQVE